MGGSSHIGGLVGRNEGAIEGSYALGTLLGSNRLGGFVGSNDGSGTISNSYSSVDVSSNYFKQNIFGGLVGQNFGAISNSYANGIMVVNENSAGGLVGTGSGTTTKSFWDTETTGQLSSAGGTGKTTPEMKNKSTFTWDFDTVWQIEEPQSGRVSYPYLQSNPEDPAPGLISPIVTSVSTDHPFVNRANRTEYLVVTVDFNMQMDRSTFDPNDIAFSDSVGNLLSVSGQNWENKDTRWSVNFSIDDQDVEISEIDIIIPEGQSSNGIATDGTTTEMDVFSIDLIGPFWINVLQNDPTAENPISNNEVIFSVEFSEFVGNIAASDFKVSTDSGDVTGDIASVSATSGMNITVTVDNIKGDGTLLLDMAASDNISDQAGNNIAIQSPTGTRENFTIDNTPPTILNITSSEITSIETESGIDDPTTETVFTVLITFSEELAIFDDQMLIIDNAELNELTTEDQIEYVLTISPLADGEIKVTTPEALGEDPAGNKSEAAANPFLINYFATPTKVVLKLPEDGESDLTLTPDFSWEVVNLAGSYNLEISKDVDFDPSEVVYTAIDIVEPEYLLPNQLDYDERYYWRVQAVNEMFAGEWSDVRSFVTIPEPPAAVVLETPNDEQIDVVLKPEFRWEEVDRAAEYQLQVSTTERFDDPVINQTELDTTLFASDQDLDTEQEHYWRVRGINAGGKGEWSDVRTFTTQPAPPSQVVLMNPANQTGSVQLQAKFEWEEAERATQYQLQISSDPQFEDLISVVEDLNTRTFTVDDILNNFETYYWQVRAENSGGLGEWSESGRFVTEAIVPELLFPANDVVSISIAPELTWESDYEDVEFEVRLGRSENLDQPEVQITTGDLNTQLSNLETSTEYFWSVRVVAYETTSSWSDIRSFTTRVPFEVQEQITQAFTFPQESSNTIVSEDYRLLAIPGSDEVYIDELFTGPYRDEWRAYIDNGANDDFLEEYDEENNRLKIGGGTGLWVYNRGEVATNFEIIQQVDENDVFTIELHLGWNIISNPFTNPVRWSDVLEYNEINADLYEYGSMFSLATEMAPFGGYYFYNDPAIDMVELSIPMGNLQDRRMKKPASMNPEATVNNPKLRLRGYLSEGEKEREQIASVELVIVESITGEEQSPHPSLNNSHYGAVFVTADDRLSMRSFRTDEVVYDREGSEHQLTIKAPVGSTLMLETDFEDSPAHAAVLLVNPVTNRSHIFMTGDDAVIDVTEPRIDYNMYVGDETFLLEIQGNLIPEQITLENNYPNPFNNQAVIRYALIDNNEIDVRLDVYDILGRRVQTLVNERQSSGWYTETFNGAGLASGVYLYRLIAGGEILTGKMMLVK